MEIWTEYEGRTIDGAFPLTRLLRPEGSSAFFTTSNEAGPGSDRRPIPPDPQHRNWYSMDEHLQGTCVTVKVCVFGAAAAKLPCCA